MSTAPLGTLQIARRLEESGFSRQQAEGLADAFAGLVVGDLATKADLREAASGLDHKVELLRRDLSQTEASLRRDMGAIEQSIVAKLTRRMSLGFAALAVLIGVLGAIAAL